MAKSDIMMGADDIAALDAEMEAEVSAPAGESRESVRSEPAPSGRKTKAEPKLEFVAPDEGEGSGEGEGDEEKPAKKAEGEKKPAPEGNLQKALQEERKRRQERDRELEAERLKYASERARLEERLNMINEALARRQQPQQPGPQDQDPLPPEDDVIGRQQWLIRQQQRSAQQQAEANRQWQAQQAQYQRMTAQERAVQTVVGETKTAFQAAAQADPAIWDAYQHLRNTRIREMQAFRIPQHQIDEALKQEEINAVQFARAQGVPYHEVVRAYAEARGWAPKAPEQARNGQNGNGRPRDPDTGQFASERDDNAGKLERLAKTVAASDTLSNSGGSAPGSIRLSLESIDKMSPGDLQALVKRVEREGGEGAVDRMLAKMSGVSPR